MENESKIFAGESPTQGSEECLTDGEHKRCKKYPFLPERAFNGWVEGVDNLSAALIEIP